MQVHATFTFHQQQQQQPEQAGSGGRGLCKKELENEEHKVAAACKLPVKVTPSSDSPKLSFAEQAIKVRCRWELVSLREQAIKVRSRWELVSLREQVIHVRCQVRFLTFLLLLC